jgi:hypothetical protein
MDTEYVDKKKKYLLKMLVGVVAVVTTKRSGLHLLVGATNNRSLSGANGREWLVAVVAEHRGG